VTPAVAALLIALPLAAASPTDCHELRKRGQTDKADACYRRLSTSSDPYLRAEGLWGLRLYQDANEQFKAAVARSPKNAEFRVRWGRLFLERFNSAEAASLFKEALEIDPKHAGALLGLALVASESFADRKAVELAEKAIESDPNLYQARELLAHLALEDANPERAVAEADKAIALSPLALDAMAVRAAVELLADRSPDKWFGRVYQVNPNYGEAHRIAGHHLVINRRYAEGVQQFRKAIELDPLNWSAREQLGVNLMRFGEDEEARQHLEACYNAGHHSFPVVNTLRLMDSYKNFVIYRTPATILKLHKKEAELLRVYFEPELQRAIQTFQKKYKLTLPRPVQLEVYPDHEDFAVRTLGMPGLGALGVTFGHVVAMDSPSGRKPGSFHWASTLWHELSHVFVLTATNHRVPRWFTEGLAVHEETAVSPDWGDRLSPQILAALRDKRLLPVAELDRGFIRPTYPGQVVVSYFQAGRICDYINERWGYQKLLDMMHAFGARKSTPEVIQQQLGMSPEAFDQDFLAWLDKQTRKTVEAFSAWPAKLKALAAAARAGNHDQVLKDGPALRDLYPEYVEHGNPYEFIAEAHLAKGDQKAAAAELERYAQIGGRNPETLKKLAGLQEQLGDKQGAAVTLNRITYIYLHDEEVHRRLGELWLEVGNWRGAVREFKAVIAANPIDRAQAHFNLARAYDAGKQRPQAEEHLLLALEAAPGFRPAQKMLLHYHRTESKKE
jgi:tetratricopeptide (TPR) repeat protein